MYMVGLGLLLLIMKLAEFGPVGAWSWWFVLMPFGLAIVWWAWADSSGWTKRREIDKMDARKVKRRNDNLDALGIDKTRGRRR